jgi:hypothetical protein
MILIFFYTLPNQNCYVLLCGNNALKLKTVHSSMAYLCTLAETEIGRLVYANGQSGGTVVTITLLFTFIMILLTVRLPTHLEQTKSV